MRKPIHLIEWSKRVWEHMGRARTLGLAAEMSFWLFLALLPLAAVTGLVAARIAIGNSSLIRPFLRTMPFSAQELISHELSRVAAWNGGAVAPFAALTFLWFASSGIHAIFDAFEAQTGVSRPWWKKRLLALGSCVALSVGVALLTVLGVGLDWLWTLMGERLPEVLSSGAVKLGRVLAGALLGTGLVAGLFRVGVPSGARRKMPLLPGTGLVIVLQSALGYGYGYYVKKVGDGGAYLAGLAAIGVTMTTLYLFSLCILIGLELNQVLGEHRAAKTGVPHQLGQCESGSGQEAEQNVSP